MNSSGSTRSKARLEDRSEPCLADERALPGCPRTVIQSVESSWSSRWGPLRWCVRSVRSGTGMASRLLCRRTGAEAEKAEPVVADDRDDARHGARGRSGSSRLTVIRARFSPRSRTRRAQDHFTLVFDKPVKVKSIAVVTGRPDGSDALEQGKLTVSADGKILSRAGTVRRRASRRQRSRSESIIAVRIQPGAKSDHHLAIRELTVESDPPVAVFKYPVEFVIDVADEPKMKDWAENVAKICTRAYPMINEELKSDGFKPPTVVTLAMKTRLSRRGVCLGEPDHRLGEVLSGPPGRRRGHGPRDDPRRAALQRPRKPGLAGGGSERLHPVFQVRAGEDRANQRRARPLQRQLSRDGRVPGLRHREVRQAARAEAEQG